MYRSAVSESLGMKYGIVSLNWSGPAVAYLSVTPATGFHGAIVARSNAFYISSGLLSQWSALLYYARWTAIMFVWREWNGVVDNVLDDD